MKKEVLLSIAIGFAVGLLITFGVYIARQSLKSANQIRSPQAESLGTEEDEDQFQSVKELSLSSPLDQSIVDKTKVLVSGHCAPQIPVVILYEKGEKLVIADDKGNFETEIELEGGENQIEVQAIYEDGQRVNKKLTVVYSTAEI